MRNAQVQILSAPSDANAEGDQIDVNQVVSASFVPHSASADATGTIKLQCCNQVPTNTRQNFVCSVWADIPNATSAVANGVGPAIVIGNMAFSYIRAIYTKASGGNPAVVITVDMNILST